MKNQERVQIFIDGGNFYHLALKKINQIGVNFCFEKFARFLANGRVISDLGKRFYVGMVAEQADNLKSKNAMAQQMKLFTYLRNNNWQVKTSKLMLRQEKLIIDSRIENFQEIRAKGIKQIEYQRFREKGIDVKIATDLVVGAMDDKYSTAVLVSSDMDLIPAIDLVRWRFNKKVEYIGFSIKDTKPSHGLINQTDAKKILTQPDLEQFVQPAYL